MNKNTINDGIEEKEVTKRKKHMHALGRAK